MTMMTKAHQNLIDAALNLESSGPIAPAPTGRAPPPPPPSISDVFNKKLIQNTNTNVDSNMMETTSDEELSNIVSEMRRHEAIIDTDVIYEKIRRVNTLTHKCILARKHLPSQSTAFEKICKDHLEIGPAINETSGDGNKNGVNYEIKVSIHAKKSKINFVQIRPDHNIDYYILIAYNMYENDANGQAHIFKIPSIDLYELVVRYGGYAHGTLSVLGDITLDNMNGRNCEYALRCDPNATGGRNFELWNELINYTVAYNPNNF